MAHKIIAINRQSGSGGAYIGAKAAEELGIICYNKQLLEMAIEFGGLDQAKHAELFKHGDEKRPNQAFYRIYKEGNENVTQEGSAADTIFELQKKLIIDIAQKEDAIIIGRCGGFILDEMEDVSLLSVFITGGMDDRVKRVEENSHMNELGARRFVKKTDKQRGDYYYHITRKHWESTENYDLVLNSEKLGLDNCAKILAACMKEYL